MLLFQGQCCYMVQRAHIPADADSVFGRHWCTTAVCSVALQPGRLGLVLFVSSCGSNYPMLANTPNAADLATCCHLLLVPLLQLKIVTPSLVELPLLTPAVILQIRHLSAGAQLGLPVQPDQVRVTEPMQQDRCAGKSCSAMQAMLSIRAGI